MLSKRLLQAKARAQAQAKRLAKDDTGALNQAVVGSLILAMVAIVIGASLVTTVANQTAVAQANADVTGATDSLVGLLPILFVVVIVLAAVGFMALKKG